MTCFRVEFGPKSVCLVVCEMAAKKRKSGGGAPDNTKLAKIQPVHAPYVEKMRAWRLACALHVLERVRLTAKVFAAGSPDAYLTSVHDTEDTLACFGACFAFCAQAKKMDFARYIDKLCPPMPEPTALKYAPVCV